MLTDLTTMIWKEWKEYFLQRGNMRGGLVGYLVVLGVLGAYLPYQTGPEWVRSPAPMALWSWLPLFLVSSLVADSFAGERERGTLEAILATRLPDRAILLGKILALVLYGFAFVVLGALLALLTVNVAYSSEGLLLYSPLLALGIVAFGLLFALLAASAGVLISLRAPTARQAAQTMSIAIMILLFVPILGFQALPATLQQQLYLALGAPERLRPTLLGLSLAIALADVLAVAACLRRFRRAQLILA